MNRCLRRAAAFLSAGRRSVGERLKGVGPPASGSCQKSDTRRATPTEGALLQRCPPPLVSSFHLNSRVTRIEETSCQHLTDTHRPQCLVQFDFHIPSTLRQGKFESNFLILGRSRVLGCSRGLGKQVSHIPHLTINGSCKKRTGLVRQPRRVSLDLQVSHLSVTRFPQQMDLGLLDSKL